MDKTESNNAMTKTFSNSSVKRIAREIVDVRDEKRKAVLNSMTSDMKCKVVEAIVSIRLERLRDSRGNISPAKVSER
jgi:hypothetical protein